ncbi:MAG: DUF6899 family protein [Mycobacteriaceae bacterium]
MPYVKGDIKSVTRPHTTSPAECTGELNFQLTSLAIEYLRRHGLSYSTINDVLGAFDGAAREFYRRVAVPYEDDCISANGDVYPEGFTSGRPNRGL